MNACCVAACTGTHDCAGDALAELTRDAAAEAEGASDDLDVLGRVAFVDITGGGGGGEGGQGADDSAAAAEDDSSTSGGADSVDDAAAAGAPRTVT